jgi:hypothetical protein
MSWEQLIAIAREAADEAAAERSRPPEACPLCGEPLDTSRRGILFCPFDGWRPD